MKLYKILVNDKSCHGGKLKWSLPKDGKPGKWHKVKGDLNICLKGIHLTTKPHNWYKWGCVCYEAEAKGIKEWEDDKCVCQEARLLKVKKHPQWWLDCEGFVSSLKDIPWFKPDGKPKKEWKLFETRSAAWSTARGATSDATWYAASDATRGATWYTAWDAARGAARVGAKTAASDATRYAARGAAKTAARDVELYVQVLVCRGLPLDKKHKIHAKKRMEVWQKGYGLLCDVDGVLYVYKSN